MDDRSALIEDYEMTIESMRREIMLLTGRLEEPIETSQTQKEFARLENALEIYRQDIEGNTADLFEGKKKLFELKAEEEWVKVSSPE